MNTSTFFPQTVARRRAAPLWSAVALAALALLSACGNGAAPDAKAASAAGAASAPADPMLVTAPVALAERLRVATASTEPVAEPLRVVASIDFNEQAVARIGASVTGRVTDLQAVPGQAVRAGEVLAQLHSAELGGSQLAYLKANAQRELALKAVERARLLLAADVIGSAELQRRENELGIAEVERRAAADQLRVMGVPAGAIAQTASTGAITSISSVVSTVNGVVVDRKITKGQVVQPADVLFTVADLSRVWVVAQVPESEVARVRPGQNVHIEVAANGVEALRGQLVWVADTVNPETRTVTVRTEIDNPKRHLKPAMLATMVIEPLPIERLVVPASAVVREDNLDHVFVRTGGDAARTYRLTRVKLGMETSGLRVVESGLAGGEKIVIDGAFHLNNERKRAEMEGS
ncbi:MAG: efflux RND transporter periplasmic adaptor subunit [Burkholderiales bacterium]